MSQQEVYEVLKVKRLSGCDSYFSQSRISRLILDGKVSGRFVGSSDSTAVSRDLRRLQAIGILESTRIDGVKCFRVRLKVLSDD